MPKKLNFLGGQQNYNESNGEYESALVGPNGQVVKDADGDGKINEAKTKKYNVYLKVGDKKPSGSFVNEKEAHEFISKNGGAAEIRYETYEEKDAGKPFDEELKRAVSNYCYQHNIEPEEISYADVDDIAMPKGATMEDIKRLYSGEKDFNEPLKDTGVEKAFDKDGKEIKKEGVSTTFFKLDKAKYPDVQQTPYGFIYNVDGTSIEDIAAHMKQTGMDVDPSKKYGFSVSKDGEEYVYESFEDAYNSIKGNKGKEKSFDKNGNEITGETKKSKFSDSMLELKGDLDQWNMMDAGDDYVWNKGNPDFKELGTPMELSDKEMSSLLNNPHYSREYLKGLNGPTVLYSPSRESVLYIEPNGKDFVDKGMVFRKSKIRNFPETKSTKAPDGSTYINAIDDFQAEDIAEGVSAKQAWERMQKGETFWDVVGNDLDSEPRNQVAEMIAKENGITIDKLWDTHDVNYSKSKKNLDDMYKEKQAKAEQESLANYKNVSKFAAQNPEGFKAVVDMFKKRGDKLPSPQELDAFAKAFGYLK